MSRAADPPDGAIRRAARVRLAVLAILVLAVGLASCQSTSAEETAVRSLQRGVELARAGDLDGAAALFEQAAEERPGFVDPLMFLGNLEERRSDLDAARAAYERVLQLDPTLTAAGVALAMTYAREERLDEAEQWLRRALEADPGYEPTVFNLGAIAERRGRLDEAAEWYRLAATLDRIDPTALVRLTGVHLAADRPADALIAADEALARLPGDETLQALRARAAAAAGE